MLVRFWFYLNLGGPWRRRLAGGEHCSCDLQMALHFLCERMRATEHAPRDPFYVFEHRHGLAEIVERGAGVLAERPRVSPSHPERGVITISENASRHWHRSAQQKLGFFEAL